MLKFLKSLNLPNKLTLMRIVMVPLFMLCFMLVKHVDSYAGYVALSLISFNIFVAAAVTDFIDGKLARSQNLITNFGKFMDPLADKFLIIGSLIAAAYVYDGHLRFWLLISLAITVFRELAVSGIRLLAVNAENVVIAAALPGKIKTFSQCIFVGLVILERIVFCFSDFFVLYTPLTYLCMVVMVFFTIYSGVQYILEYKKYLNND